MLLLRKKSLFSVMLLMFVCALSACDLQPIYATNHSLDSIGVPEELASVHVASVTAGRTGQRLQAAVEDLLNPTGENTEGDYSLSISIETRKNPLAIEQDAEITRYNLEFISKIHLVENSTGKVVLAEKSKITGSFKTVESDFATFTVEEDTLKRLIKESAQTIRIRLSSFFLRK